MRKSAPIEVVVLSLIHICTVDIHLAAAIGTIKQACEGSCFAPAVRVASDIPTDFRHKVKGLLVNNGFVRILKNRPFVLRDKMCIRDRELSSQKPIRGVVCILLNTNSMYTERNI